MSSPTLHDFRNGVAGNEPFDDKMHQIRELLFGEFKRDSDARLALIEARVRELELGLHRKLDAIQARLDQLSGDVVTERHAAFDDLSRHIVELGERIGRIGRA